MAIAEDVAGRRLPAWALWVVVALTVVGVLAAAGFAVWHLDMARRATERLYVQAVEERRALERESMRLGADREQLRGERDRLARERDRLAVERDSLVARLAQTERVLRGVGAERDSAAAAAGVAESQVTVERATNQRLASQLRVLEAENARLKADQRYLESLLPSDGSAGSISMRGVQFVPDGVPRTWRYRALLMQGGRSERVFDGSLQLVVSGVRDGKPVTLVWPRKDEPSTVEAMSVRFTRSLRVEGTVELPEGMSVKSAQLRVLEKGAVRAQQQAAL